MERIKSATLEVELARREVLRNLKAIKESIHDFMEEAKESKAYSPGLAVEAFKCIEDEVENQAARWIYADEGQRTWDEV